MGKKIAARRRELFLTQSQVGDAIGMSDENIGRIERADVAGILTKQIPKLADVLKIDIEIFRREYIAEQSQAQADNGKRPDPAPTISQIDVDGMSRVDLARRALEILKRLRDTADTEQAKQRFRGAILSCERIIQSNESQRKKQARKAKGA